MIPDLFLGQRLSHLFPVEQQAQAADVERTIEDRINYPTQRFVITCTSTTRPTSARAGDRIYETDTGNELTWNGTAWLPPDNLPWGIIGKASITAGQTFTTLADVTGLSVTWTAVGGRQYRVQVHGLLRSSVVNDIAQLLIADGSNNTISVGQVACLATTFAFQTSCFAVVTPSAGSVTYKVRCVRSNGSGTVTLDAAAAYPAWLLVEDIGPA
jgi:hypothetical protein